MMAVDLEEFARFRALWASVLHLAIDDSCRPVSRNVSERDAARRLIRSDVTAPCSFVWICETVLGVSAEAARKRICVKWR